MIEHYEHAFGQSVTSVCTIFDKRVYNLWQAFGHFVPNFETVISLWKGFLVSVSVYMNTLEQSEHYILLLFQGISVESVCLTIRGLVHQHILPNYTHIAISCQANGHRGQVVEITMVSYVQSNIYKQVESNDGRIYVLRS